MAEVVVPNTQIQREPVRHLPVILDKRSSVKPAQDLIQVAGQSTVRHVQCRTTLRERLILGEVKEVGKTEPRPEQRAGKPIVVMMPVDIGSRAYGVTAVSPSQHVMPAVVLMHPASRTPLVISGQP